MREPTTLGVVSFLIISLADLKNGSTKAESAQRRGARR
jgi:hypothetical protein